MNQFDPSKLVRFDSLELELADPLLQSLNALDTLRQHHRGMAEEIVALSRKQLKLISEGRDASHPDYQEIQAAIASLQEQKAQLDAEIEAESKNYDALFRAQKDHPAEDGSPRGSSGLIRVRHPNRDFFLADLFDYAIKDDGASMEAPLFSLSTKPDLSIWEWKSKDGNKSVKVAPSVLGRATQHDKDVLIYVVSQLTEALNRSREDAKNRTIRFPVYDFLVTINRGVSGDDYNRLQQAFERLAGTRITTDIKTGGERVKQGFGLIDEWRIIEKAPDDERMIAVEITLSRWLFNAVQAFEVLTIDPDYFRLRKPLARRMYEIARKHCGHQSQWSIGLQLLQYKAGSKSELREFRRAVKAIQDDNSLPEYRLTIDQDDKVTFFARRSAGALPPRPPTSPKT